MPRPFIGIVLAAAALAACTPVRSYHGYVLERANLDEDEAPETVTVTADVGVDTKQTVLVKYGEPSTLSTFDGNIWYYISARERRYAFFRDKTTWRRVVAVHFNEQGSVEAVREYDLEDGREVVMVSRETPTKGKELTLLEQIFGNVGQLPAPGAGDAGGPGGPRAP
ncbi:MAG: outer membrane protein assembly factor BamE [Pseudomonadota bacterium]